MFYKELKIRFFNLSVPRLRSGHLLMDWGEYNEQLMKIFSLQSRWSYIVWSLFLGVGLDMLVNKITYYQKPCIVVKNQPLCGLEHYNYGFPIKIFEGGISIPEVDFTNILNRFFKFAFLDFRCFNYFRCN